MLIFRLWARVPPLRVRACACIVMFTWPLSWPRYVYVLSARVMRGEGLSGLVVLFVVFCMLCERYCAQGEGGAIVWYRVVGALDGAWYVCDIRPYGRVWLCGLVCMRVELCSCHVWQL